MHTLGKVIHALFLFAMMPMIALNVAIGLWTGSTPIILKDATIVIFAAFILVIFGSAIWFQRQRNKRRASLHRDDAGLYLWTDLNGTAQSSAEDPSRNDGEWDKEDWSSGDRNGN